MMIEKTHDIQAIIFDLGRVLVAIDNHFLVDKLFKGLAADNLQELGRKTMGDPAMVQFNCGRMRPEVFHRQMCERYGLNEDFEAFTTLWCGIFFTMDGMEDLVRKLAQKIRIGLLSDTDPIHWNYICEQWPWIKNIKNPTLSFEVGVMKPHANIYLTAANNVNTAAEHCLFVDDLQSNVEGACAAGMQAIQFHSVAQLQQQLKDILNPGVY